MVVAVNAKKRTGTVYRSRTEIPVLTEDDELDGAEVVPGWRLPVKDIFSLRPGSQKLRTEAVLPTYAFEVVSVHPGP